jgi:hypothetical protein
MSLSHLRADCSPNFGLKPATSMPCRYFISVVTVAIASGATQLLDLVSPESPNLRTTLSWSEGANLA